MVYRIRIWQQTLPDGIVALVQSTMIVSIAVQRTLSVDREVEF